MKTIEELQKEKEELKAKAKEVMEYDKLKKEVKDLKFKTSWFGRIKSKTSPVIRGMEKKVLPKVMKGFSNIGKNITAEWEQQEKKTKKKKKDGIPSYL